MKILIAVMIWLVSLFVCSYIAAKTLSENNDDIIALRSAISDFKKEVKKQFIKDTNKIINLIKKIIGDKNG